MRLQTVLFGSLFAFALTIGLCGLNAARAQPSRFTCLIGGNPTYYYAVVPPPRDESEYRILYLKWVDFNRAAGRTGAATCMDSPRMDDSWVKVKFPPAAGKLGNSSGTDMADGDPSTRSIACVDGRRGDRSSCTLGPTGSQGIWKFRLHIGKKLPIFQGTSMILCKGETVATFYLNGRIKSCTIGALNPEGGGDIGLSDTSNRPKTCNSGSSVEFDDLGRVLSCD